MNDNIVNIGRGKTGRIGLAFEKFERAADDGDEALAEHILPLAGKARSFPVCFYGSLPSPEELARHIAECEGTDARAGLTAGINTEPEAWMKPALRALLETIPLDYLDEGERYPEDLADVLLVAPADHPRHIDRLDTYYAILAGFGLDAVAEGDPALGRINLAARLKQVGHAGKEDALYPWFERHAASLIRSARAHLSDAHAVQHMRQAMTHVRSAAKVGRNDPCPCGSGKKFKKCCRRAS